MDFKVGKKYTAKKINEYRKNNHIKTSRFAITIDNYYKIEFLKYYFISDDKGKTYTLVSDGKKSIEYNMRKNNVPTYITSDRRNSGAYYTRHTDKAGGKEKFNPVTKTAGPRR